MPEQGQRPGGAGRVEQVLRQEGRARRYVQAPQHVRDVGVRHLQDLLLAGQDVDAPRPQALVEGLDGRPPALRPGNNGGKREDV